MSLTPYFNMAILSIPNPNARPEYVFESISQFSSTTGFTIPHHNISSHLSLSYKLSTSADGYVKGKKDGLNLIITFSPKRFFISLS